MCLGGRPVTLGPVIPNRTKAVAGEENLPTSEPVAEKTHPHTQTFHGTAIGLPISWGGASGVNVGIYGSPMECLGYGSLPGHVASRSKRTRTRTRSLSCVRSRAVRLFWETPTQALSCEELLFLGDQQLKAVVREEPEKEPTGGPAEVV